MATRRSKIVRSAVRRVKRSESKNTKNTKLKSLRSRKHSSRKLNMRGMRWGGAPKPEPDTIYDVYVLKTQMEICCILLIEQRATPNVYIFYDNIMAQRQSDAFHSGNYRLPPIELSKIMSGILGDEFRFGDIENKKENIASKLHKFSYCVMITQPVKSAFSFTSPAIYGYSILDEANLSDTSNLKKLTSFVFDATTSKKIDNNSQLKKVLQTLNKDIIVAKLKEFVQKSIFSEVTSRHNQDKTDETYNKLTLSLSFTDNGTLTFTEGKLKAEQIDELFDAENKKLKSSISQLCSESEGIKLMIKLSLYIKFKKEADKIILQKAGLESEIYDDETKMEAVKAELIAEIEELRKKHDNVTFTNDDRTTLVKWVENSKIACSDTVEDVKKQFSIDMESDYMNYNYEYVNTPEEIVNKHIKVYRSIIQGNKKHAIWKEMGERPD